MLIVQFACKDSSSGLCDPISHTVIDSCHSELICRSRLLFRVVQCVSWFSAVPWFNLGTHACLAVVPQRGTENTRKENGWG